MFKLISDRDVLPKSLFIDGVRTKGGFSAHPIGMGGFGNVYKGEYGKQQVALKVIYKGQKKVSALLLVSPDDTDYFARIRCAKTFVGKL